MTANLVGRFKNKGTFELLWVVLFPLSCLWMCLTTLRRKYFPKSQILNSSLSIICVGNIHSGGSGKTPIVKSIVLKLKPFLPVLLARGYGGSLSGEGAEIDIVKGDGYSLYGDEPWMVAKQMSIPVFIGRDRRRMIKKIEEKYPKSIVIMDDGFQRLSLKKDVSLVCINTDKSLLENFCLPLGELREPISAIGSADAVILTPGADTNGLENWRQLIGSQFPSLPIFVPELKFEGFFAGEQQVEVSPEEKIVSFCGIAAPERFISFLAAKNTRNLHLKSFPDHHLYSQSDVDYLVGQGNQYGARTYITTDKDWFKVVPLFKGLGLQLVSLRHGYDFSAGFWELLLKKLEGKIA